MQWAALFPGQGSQAVGMGVALAEAFPTAARTWQEASDALGENLRALAARCAIEPGHGKVLAGLARRIAPELKVQPCGAPADVSNLN
jgi:malonyl CoA-acyl carrier protein transacylase